MPIRINLLAEGQAAEDLRRRDPVKRVIVVGVLLLAALIVWSSGLQLKIMVANSKLSSVQIQIDQDTNAYQMAITSQQQTAATRVKIAQLAKLTNARLLQGNLLNALQMVTVDNVQLTGVKVYQAYIPLQHAGKMDSVTERTMITLDARDSSANPGDQVGKYKAALAAQPYFKQMLDPTNAINLVDESSPQQDNQGRNYVSFRFECHFPDKIR
jgi:hypothetical protein